MGRSVTKLIDKLIRLTSKEMDESKNSLIL